MVVQTISFFIYRKLVCGLRQMLAVQLRGMPLRCRMVALLPGLPLMSNRGGFTDVTEPSIAPAAVGCLIVTVQLTAHALWRIRRRCKERWRSIAAGSEHLSFGVRHRSRDASVRGKSQRLCLCS